MSNRVLGFAVGSNYRCALGFVKVSYNFVGDRDGVYDRTSSVEMTQMNPWPEQPATEIQLPDTDDFSHIIIFFRVT